MSASSFLISHLTVKQTNADLLVYGCCPYGSHIRINEWLAQTKSRWAQMARSDKHVMQFLSEGRYFANVVDEKATFYSL